MGGVQLLPFTESKDQLPGMQDGGPDCPRVDEEGWPKRSRASLSWDVFSAVHLVGLGSSTEDTKKQVLRLFFSFFLFLAGQIPSEWLRL